MRTPPPSLDRYQGCLLGLALGDALGAPHEGGPLERALWGLLGTTSRGERRWTDDTQMSIDLAESLLARGAVDPADLAARFATSYRWSRGYGPGTAKLLKRVRRGADWQEAARSVYPEGSFGNGGAMRAAVVALFHAATPGTLVDATRQSARVTHAHPLGVEGAVLIASATALALAGHGPLDLLEKLAPRATLDPFPGRLAVATRWLRAGEEPGPRDVARRLGHGIAAADSCVTAVYLAARFRDRPFAEMLAFAARAGGDVDTIGAMAGAIWGAARGVMDLPPEALARLEQRERLSRLATSLHARAHEAPPLQAVVALPLSAAATAATHP